MRRWPQVVRVGLYVRNLFGLVDTEVVAMAYVRSSSEYGLPQEPHDPWERERLRRQREAAERRWRRRQSRERFWAEVFDIPRSVRLNAAEWRSARETYWSRRPLRRPGRSSRFLNWLLGESLDDAVQRAISNLVYDLEARLVTALLMSLVVSALLDAFSLGSAVAGGVVGVIAGVVGAGAGGTVARILGSVLGGVFAWLVVQAADHFSSAIAMEKLPDVGFIEARWLLAAVAGWVAGTLVRAVFSMGWIGKVVSGGVVALLGFALWRMGSSQDQSVNLVQQFATVRTDIARWALLAIFVVGMVFLTIRFIWSAGDFRQWIVDHRWTVYAIILCAIGAAGGQYTSAAIFTVLIAVWFVFVHDVAMWIMGYALGIMAIPRILWMAGRRAISSRRNTGQAGAGK